jgi:hypothetical protein
MGYYFLIDNTDECTSIKTCTFTYNPLILQHVSICSDHPQGEQTETCQNIRGLYVKVYILILVHLLALFIKLFINAEI